MPGVLFLAGLSQMVGRLAGLESHDLIVAVDDSDEAASQCRDFQTLQDQSSWLPCQRDSLPSHSGT